MKQLICNGTSSATRAAVILALFGLVAPAWCGDKAAPARTPKLREVVEIPEDYLGQTLTYSARITTTQTWMKRGSNGDFFLFIQDLEGSQLPNGGISPDSSVNLLRFILPKEEGRKLIDRLAAGKFYEAKIRFTIERERAVIGPGWVYLAKINKVELP